MRPILIGLAGRMGAGKTTVADHLMSQHGFAEYSFALPLKEMVCQLLSIPRAELEDMKRSEDAILPARGGVEFPCMRVVLQTLGTEWGRQLIHPDMWLAVAARRIQAFANDPAKVGGVVISDIRFENEADFVREQGGVVLHIKNLKADALLSTHISEQQISRHEDDFDIDNNGTITDLHHGMDKLLHRLHGVVSQGDSSGCWPSNT